MLLISLSWFWFFSTSKWRWIRKPWKNGGMHSSFNRSTFSRNSNVWFQSYKRRGNSGGKRWALHKPFVNSLVNKLWQYDLGWRHKWLKSSIKEFIEIRLQSTLTNKCWKSIGLAIFREIFCQWCNRKDILKRSRKR